MNEKFNADLVSGISDEPVGERATAPRRMRLLDGMMGKLKVYGDIPGYHLAIVNDDGQRIAECLQRGYEFVRAGEIKGVDGNVVSYNTDPGGKVRFVVGAGEGAEPMYGYLMKQPLEFRSEDLEDLEQRNAAVDAAIRGGTVNNSANERRYIPTTGIKYDPDHPSLVVPRKE